MTDRDTIYNALYQRLKTKLAGQVTTTGRRHMMPPVLTTALQPAVFVIQAGESRVLRGTSYKITLRAFVIAYCYDTGPNPDGTTKINVLIGAIEDAIAPDIDIPGAPARQTLSDLVYNCWIDGDSDIDPGIFGQQQIAVIPVSIAP